jgi:hypothetical protein
VRYAFSLRCQSKSFYHGTIYRSSGVTHGECQAKGITEGLTPGSLFHDAWRKDRKAELQPFTVCPLWSFHFLTVLVILDYRELDFQGSPGVSPVSNEEMAAGSRAPLSVSSLPVREARVGFKWGRKGPPTAWGVSVEAKGCRPSRKIARDQDKRTK